MAETLSTLSIISFIVAGVCFVLAVYLFIFFKIPTVIGDLTAKNARKSIARMREENEKSGNKSYKTSKTNMARGKLTETMQKSGKPHKKEKTFKIDDASSMPETGILSENKNSSELEDSTSLLLDDEATGRLDEVNQTELLNETSKSENQTSSVKLTIVDEITLIHTDEVI